LTIYSNAEIKGTFTAGRLIIPPGNIFRWKEQLKLGSAEIAGELVADIRVEKSIFVSSTGRLFGHIEAGSLTVEAGGVAVGETRIGSRESALSTQRAGDETKGLSRVTH
jgi:cytoskeletal protein CcmA (bactofilin family)